MKKLLFILLAFVGMQLGAQDMAHYKRIVKELSSAKYQGRGYAKGGANKAGKFLKKEYEKAGADEVTVQPSPSTSRPLLVRWRCGRTERSYSPVSISRCANILQVYMVSSLSIMSIR